MGAVSAGALSCLYCFSLFSFISESHRLAAVHKRLTGCNYSHSADLPRLIALLSNVSRQCILPTSVALRRRAFGKSVLPIGTRRRPWLFLVAADHPIGRAGKYRGCHKRVALPATFQSVAFAGPRAWQTP
jgi:hypothetical protein